MGGANNYSLLKQMLSEAETRCLQSPDKMTQNWGHRVKIYHATFPDHSHSIVTLQNSAFLTTTDFLFWFPFAPDFSTQEK